MLTDAPPETAKLATLDASQSHGHTPREAFTVWLSCLTFEVVGYNRSPLLNFTEGPGYES